MPSPTIREASQSAAPGALIELYTLDLTPLNVNSIYRWTPSVIEGGTVTYDGVDYLYRDLKLTDVEVNGAGNPQPKLVMGNVGNIAGALATQNDDLVGAILTRVVTFRHHLDDGDEPDPDEHYVPEVFEIKQKTGQNKKALSFALGPVEDVTEKEIPARKCIAKVCYWRYRLRNPDTGEWDYSKATCPYDGSSNGGAMYKPDGTSTEDPAEDLCGKSPRDCALRFPDQTLPYGGFPGMDT